MSTTEDQPAIGTPKWYRTRPPSVYTNGDLEFRRTHVWTDDNGVAQGNIALGGVEITFHNPQQVRDLIGRLAALAGEMDAETARQQPGHAFIRPGQVSPDRPAPDRCMECGQPEAAHAPAPLTYDGPVGDWAPQGQPPVCWQCGATEATAPLVESPEGGDWQCSNRQLCGGRQAERAAARDADTAKAGQR